MTAKTSTKPGRTVRLKSRTAGKAVTRKFKIARKLALRARLGFSQGEFARLLPVSVRSLASIEAGAKPTPAVQRRLTEIDRIITALARVMHPDTVGQWLQSPNAAFGDLKPLEVIERGEADRIWQMIYLLESGDPS